MIFEQFYLGCLSHASYLIGSQGVAAVVDPQRDVGIYLDAAERRGLAIGHIIETHLHRDFVSGHMELAAATGAKIYVGAKGGAEFDHVPVRDGDRIAFGRCVLEFLETPGHSLDSVSILVTDLDRSPEPFAVLTGDTLFIGDVGRPDLSGDYSAEQLASLLYRSLHERLLRLPDHVEVYPAHGAGSLCGRQLSSDRSSTIGREKATNYALRAASLEEFVRLVTTDLPERPSYFMKDAELNRAGARPLEALPPLAALRPAELTARQAGGAVVLDTRPPAQYASGHVPGSISIGLTGQYASWAGTLIGLGAEILLVAESPRHVTESRLRLARVGIENVKGYLEDGIAGWMGSGSAVRELPQIAAGELDRLLDQEGDRIQLVDVRRPLEWAEGAIRGARLKPLDRLTSQLVDLNQDEPVLLHCKSGYRSTIAASLLERAGFREPINVTGGFDAWKASGLPVHLPPRS